MSGTKLLVSTVSASAISTISPAFSKPKRIGMVLAFTRRSSTVSFQSAGMFCPPISQKNSQRKSSSSNAGEGSALSARTAAIGPLVFTSPLTSVLKYVTFNSMQ